MRYLAPAWMCVVVLCACESHIALDAAAAAGTAGAGATGTAGAGAAGAGGAGAGGATGGAGGTSGSGGALPPCSTLELTGEAVELPSVPNSWQGRPRIHSLPDGRAGIVHGWHAQSGPKSAGLADTVVSWLGDWPPAFEAPIELDPNRGWSYAVDRGPAPHYAILAGTSAMPPGISHGFVNPDEAPFSPSVETSASATGALLVRGGKHSYLVGMEEPGAFLWGDSYHLLAGWVHPPPNGTPYEGPYIVGCSAWPGRIDGIETDMGWLLTAPVPYGGPCSEDEVPPEPSVLTVTRFADDGMAYPGLSLPVALYITDLRVVPRPAGGWIAYGVWPGDMGPPRIEAVQMDALGLLSKDPVSLTPAGSAAFGFDAAAFGGSGIVAAFIDDPANNPPDLTVVVAGDEGIVASARIEDVIVYDPQVLGHSPDGAILVAFAESVGPEGSKIRLARFTCQP